MKRLLIGLCAAAMLIVANASWAQEDVEGPEFLIRSEQPDSLGGDNGDLEERHGDHDDYDDPGEACDDGPYCGSPHETEPNSPCEDHVDPYVIQCGSTFYGRHCTEDDHDYIPILVPAWTKMKVKIWDSSCQSNPTEHVQMKFRRVDDEDGCGNFYDGTYRNYVWLWNDTCEPWNLLVKVYGRSSSEDNDPTRYKIRAEDCDELADNPCEQTVPCEAPNPRLVEVGRVLPVCDCIQICEAEVLTLCVGPLLDRHLPLEWSFTPGCSPNFSDCESDCDPAAPTAISNWEYHPEAGLWCIDVISSTSGCFCFCLDEILPVELLDFNAIARNAEVELRFSTASESNIDYFDILRNGEIAHRVESNGDVNGGNYAWIDRELHNGVNYEYTLVAVDESGTREELGTVNATPNFAEGVLTEYELHQNYPNPFNPKTSIAFDLPEAGFVSLKVYNPIGQLIRTLVEDTRSEGRHVVTFDATNLPSGLYFYRLEAGSFTAQHKMLFIK